MSEPGPITIHASAVLVGDRAVLIRGPSGAGKSRLSFELIMAGRSGQIPPAVLVGDDRLHLDARQGELVVRPAPALAGLIEIRGLGIRRCDYAAEAIVGLLVDLSADDAERLPAASARRIKIAGVELPRLPIAANVAPLFLVVAALTTTEGFPTAAADDGLKGIGNHIDCTIATDRPAPAPLHPRNFGRNAKTPLA
jgi:serine kinase of HPr protein (carbohydrate metabolism regulator)